MLPCLTIIGDASGLFGGYIIGVHNLKINSGLYIQTALKFLTLKDIYTGLSKSFIFAIIITMVGAYQGFKTRGGAVGVGKATTVSVVTSFILIIVADAIRFKVDIATFYETLNDLDKRLWTLNLEGWTQEEIVGILEKAGISKSRTTIGRKLKVINDKFVNYIQEGELK